MNTWAAPPGGRRLYYRPKSHIFHRFSLVAVQNIGRFQVPVADAQVVQVLDARKDLAKELTGVSLADAFAVDDVD